MKPATTLEAWTRYVASMAVALTGLAGALSMAPPPVLAATQVSGGPQAVRIEAQNTSIEELLTLLGRDFDLKYTSAVDLGGQITGTYQGSLQRVLARILDGYSYVVKSQDGRIELTVLGPRNGSGTAVASVTIHRPTVPPTAAASQAASSPKPVADAPAAAVQQKPPMPVATPSTGGPVPEIKVAEGSASFPVPMPSTAPPPTPGTSGVVPELLPSTAAPPVPQPSSASLDAPQPNEVAPVAPATAPDPTQPAAKSN